MCTVYHTIVAAKEVHLKVTRRDATQRHPRPGTFHPGLPLTCKDLDRHQNDYEIKKISLDQKKVETNDHWGQDSLTPVWEGTRLGIEIRARTDINQSD